MYSIETKVYPSACDGNGKMKLYRVMQTMQDCSELWLQSEPCFEHYFQENGMTQLLAYRQLDILRQPSYGEDLKVTTSVYEVNALFGNRNTCIYDAAGKACYVSWGMGAFVNRSTGRLQKVPQEVLDSVRMDPRIDMPYTERRIILPDGEWKEYGTIDVSRHDIDYNRHVNNAEYLRIALELLPEDFAPRRIRIEYKIAAKRGDCMRTKMLNADNDIYVVLSIGDHISTAFHFCR